MLRILVIALLKDLQALIRHDVFALSGEARRKKIDELWGKKYPEVFRAYFSAVENEDLHKDSIRLIKFVSTSRFSTTDFPFFKALQSFIVKEMPALFGVHTGNSALLETVKMLQDQSEEELEKKIQRFAERFPGVSRIRVQTALALSTEDKKEIRDHFNKKNELCHVTFIVDSSLVGGMRVFKNGALFDASWVRRIGSAATLP